MLTLRCCWYCLVGEKLEDHAPPRKSKRMKAEAPAAPPQPPSLPPPPGPLTIFNPYNLFKDVREQVCIIFYCLKLRKLKKHRIIIV